MRHQQRPTGGSIFRGCVGLALMLFLFVIAQRGDAGAPDAEILPPGVSARQGPAKTAPIVAELSGGTRVEVLFTQRGPEGEWAQVALPSGGTGFVPEQALRRLTETPQWRRSVAPGPSSSSTGRRVTDGVLELPLRRAGGVFLVAAKINNQITANFIVDTGAAMVTISHVLADQLGLDYSNRPMQRLMTVSGMMESPRIVLDSIYVPDEAGESARGVDAIVATLPGAPPAIGGLLGQSFLRHFHVTIDAERAVMRLEGLGR
jgi:clan AA aspartic protease (TIGR02281 family)